MRDRDKRSYRVSFDKLPHVLPDFRPEWDVRRGAVQLYETYKRGVLTLEEFEGPRYQRISHIKKLIADGILNENLRYQENMDSIIGGAPAAPSDSV